MNLKIIDLTHDLTATTPSWDGSCGFSLTLRHEFQDGTDTLSFRIHDLSMQAGIGTHMDAPAHCFKGGQDISSIPVSTLLSPAVVIDVSHAEADFRLEVAHLKSWEKKYGNFPPDAFVVIHTGWGQYFGNQKQYRNNLVFPYVSKEAALYCLDKNIRGLGVDTLSPDRPDHGYPVHEAILGAGKYLIENIAHAHAIPARGAYILALPLKIVGGTEAPMRLVALSTDQHHALL